MKKCFFLALFVSFLLSSIILISCTEDKNLSGPIKIINFNTWHGLDPNSIWNFKEYESPERRTERLKIFISEAKKYNPDIITLQECNKLPWKAYQIAKALNMDEIHKVDNSGMKIIIGPPFNLRSGLVILARKGLSLKKITSIKLPTNHFGFTSDFFSLQLGEFRYAIIGSFIKNHQKYIIVNTHIHHGQEITKKLKRNMMDLVKQKIINKEKAKKYLEKLKKDGPIIRIKQINSIIDYIDNHFYKQPIILCGDFNASPNSEEITYIKELGFSSCYPDKYLITWDMKNPNAQFSLNFTLPTIFPEKEVNKILEKDYVFSTTLDYIFFREFKGLQKIEQAEYFCNQPVNGIYASDHFGIKTIIQ